MAGSTYEINCISRYESLKEGPTLSDLTNHLSEIEGDTGGLKSEIEQLSD